MTQTRRNQLIRIITKGICESEAELKFLNPNKRLFILTALARWEDSEYTNTIIELIKPSILQ
jgi:hypothetical protein